MNTWSTHVGDLGPRACLTSVQHIHDIFLKLEVFMRFSFRGTKGRKVECHIYIITYTKPQITTFWNQLKLSIFCPTWCTFNFPCDTYHGHCHNANLLSHYIIISSMLSYTHIDKWLLWCYRLWHLHGYCCSVILHHHQNGVVILPPSIDATKHALPM